MNFDFRTEVHRVDKRASGMRFEAFDSYAFDTSGVLIATSSGWSENGARNNVVGQVYKYYRDLHRKELVAASQARSPGRRRRGDWTPIPIDYRRL